MLLSFSLAFLAEIILGLDLRANGTCPDAQVGLQCGEHCLNEIVPCRLNCGVDVDCLLGCSLEMADCINGCPCFLTCPNGCIGCSSSFCQCTGDPTDDPNYQICREQLDDEYYKCIVACPPQDLTCINQCIREENENLENCPCMPGCLTGCPCTNYVCPGQTTTPASITTTVKTTSTTVNKLTHVLVLSTWSSSTVPLVIDGQGASRQPRFEYGSQTESFYSCSVLWKGQFYIFGGYSYKDQISRVSGCQLERVGSLGFELIYGGCATDPDDSIYLCFWRGETQTCRKSRSPTGDFTKIAQSTHEHRYTRVAASSETLFVAGSYSPGHNKAELFNFENESWKTTTSYPYASEISFVFIVNKEKDFYIFGGYVGSSSNSDKIVNFTTATENWTQIGSLNQSRQGHGVIQTGETFLVVGGQSGALSTEKCHFDQTDKMTCVTMEPTLTDFVQYPELLLAEADFCV